MDGFVADFVDLLEFEIDGATHHSRPSTSTRRPRPGDWAALKAADLERARLLKDKAGAGRELREASERTVAA